MYTDKLKLWWAKKKKENKRRERDRLVQSLLSSLISREADFNHIEQAEILYEVLTQFRKRKQQESLLCSEIANELQIAISKIPS